MQRPGEPGHDDYTLDDLVKHERQQMWFVALLLVVAVIYFALGGGPLGPQPKASPFPTPPAGTSAISSS